MNQVERCYHEVKPVNLSRVRWTYWIQTPPLGLIETRDSVGSRVNILEEQAPCSQVGLANKNAAMMDGDRRQRQTGLGRWRRGLWLYGA